jgi:curved DNA-binding protein CbpA
MNQNDMTYYDILKVSPHASDEDVREAYCLMAKIFHPDQNPKRQSVARKRFQKINEAYLALKTSEKRRQYNNVIAQKNIMSLSANNDNTSEKTGILAQMAQIFWPHRGGQ